MRRSLPLIPVLLTLALLVPVASGAAAAPSGVSPSALNGDFNGDGYADLASGVPKEEVGSAKNGGGVNVIYASGSGLASAGNQLWTQESPGIARRAQKGAWFGFATAASDFNGDGYSDLAVGVPEIDLGSANAAGAVSVIYGSASGLSSAGNQFWTQDSAGVVGKAEAGDEFGRALAAGDINGDGYSDLAVGAPGDGIGNAAGAGGVNVIYGSAGGLTSPGNQFWSQDSAGITGSSVKGDGFGRALASGDFGNGAQRDLAVGSPFDSPGSVGAAGSVNVLYGSGAGLTSTGSQLWVQGSGGLLDQKEPVDLFGFDVVAGDFGNGSQADLAVGAPNESTNGAASGAVSVIYGSAGGLTSTGNQFLTLDSTGGSGQDGDGFGNALAAGDFGNNSQADLAVAAAGDQVGSVVGAGSVTILDGGAGGLSTSGTMWSQDSAGIVGQAQTNDFAGADVWAADFDNNGQADLVIADTYEDIAGAVDAGGANVIYGSSGGLTSTGNQFWSQNSAGILGTAKTDDEFAFSVV